MDYNPDRRPRKSPAPDPAAPQCGAAQPAAPAPHRHPDGQDHPDRLDARVLRITGVCVLARLMAILDITVVSVAQRTFITEFGSTQAIVAWTMTGYTLALATVIPMAGWAADRVGTKRLFMGSVLAFTTGSLLCAMAPNITLLIAFRVLEGLGGGMLLPLKFTILTREGGPRRIGRLLAALGVPSLLGPIGGPVLGGWLIGTFDWQWIFLINVPIGIAAFVFAGIVFPKDHPSGSGTFDFVGVLLLSPGLAVFLYGVSSIPGYGTVADGHVWLPATLGMGLIAGFVVHALHRTDHPLIDLRLFENRVVALANSTMFLCAAAFFGAILLFPSYLQQLLHQTPLQSGVHLIPQGLGAMLTIPLAGVFADRGDPGKVVLVGITLITLGMGTFAYGVSQQAPYLPVLLTGLAIIGMGMGATMTPLSTAAMRVLKPDEVAHGSTLFNVNLQVAGSVGTALMAMILTNQFNRGDNNGAGGTIGHRGVTPDTPDFASAASHGLSHAYAVVFAVAVALVALALIPAALLLKERAAAGPTPTPARSPAPDVVA